MTVALPETALRRAINAKQLSPGLMHHSDRGSQYCAGTYRAPPSMSRRGNRWGNAPIESAWRILKSELVHHNRFETRAAARAAMREYIEIFYNRTRKLVRLGYLSPVQFAVQYRRRQAAH